MDRDSRSSKVKSWLGRAVANTRFLQRLSIGRRLTLCFVFVIALMLVGNAVVLLQLRAIQLQVHRLNAVDEELIEVQRLHNDLLFLYERVGFLARSEDAQRLVNEATALQSELLTKARHTHEAFNRLPPGVTVDPTVITTLESIEGTLPSHLGAILNAARSGDWNSVRLRSDRQLQPLGSLSSELVNDVADEVERQRAQAAVNIANAEERMFLAVPVTGLLTLLLAAGLGAAVTNSITDPLGRLVEGSRTLASGDFDHFVRISGEDELSHLSKVFNETTAKLGSLYEALRSREAYLEEAQRLSHSGSWAWKVGSDRLYWSDEAFRIYGVDRDTVPTIELFEARVHSDDLSNVRAANQSILDDRREADYHFRIVVPDGSTKHVRSVGHAVTNTSGEVVEILGTVIDVTEQHNAHEVLSQAFEEIKVLRDQLFKENIALREEVDKTSMFEEIVGNSGALRSVLASVAKAAPTDSTVLVTGETGTGKELIARAIHKRSQRSSRAFINVNCAAIPTTLIASELFGHEKGAFTGAHQRRPGRFELADGGTIFLDEIGELPMEAQTTLLRVLQEREFERVGGNRKISVDVRVIAATNRDLMAEINAGTFRSDLFYRLNVVPMHIPPLRDRRDDLPVLIEYFVARYSRKMGKPIRSVEKRTIELLQSYSWPGNIRELQNVIERSVVVCETEVLSVDEGWLSVSPYLVRPEIRENNFERRTPEQERRLIEDALSEARGRVSGPLGAAARLGLPASTLESKIRALNIDKYRFKRA